MAFASLKARPDRSSSIKSGLRTVSMELNGVTALWEALNNGLSKPFAEAVEIISGITGRVIVTGVGKSGHIGAKIAATLASTGTPAFFVHPAEANHGDLGMIAKDDAIVAMSWSGETVELKGIIAYSRRFNIPLVAVTSRDDSALARAADVVICLPKMPEACPHGLAPTTSTVQQLVIGDALAIALLEMRGFTPDHFRTFHPGGQLGASLTKIRDVMHQGDAIPRTSVGTGMMETIRAMSSKRFGCVVVVDEQGGLAGIFTDGDLRRRIGEDLPSKTVDQVMTRNPKTVGPDELAASAMQLIQSASITALVVVEDDKVVGFVHLHDLLKIGAA